ncbi:MAG: hypothetical protein OIF50_03885 [Flavobacteriaceae bacterium]|nr:hypothetical protein [Flavobacteriaceae bacterium]
MSQISNKYLIYLLFLLLPSLWQCKSVASLQDIAYGKKDFNAQFQNDIATCLAYIQNNKEVIRIDHIRSNVETAASIYRQIKPIYQYINQHFTLRFYEADDISMAFEGLLQKIEAYHPRSELLSAGEEIENRLLLLQREATNFPLRKEETTIVLSHMLRQLQEDFYFKLKQDQIIKSNANSNLEDIEDPNIQEKLKQAYRNKRKHIIISHLSFQKLKIYLRTLESEFNQERLYQNWQYSLNRAHQCTHPNKLTNNDQLVHLGLEIKKQNQLLRQTLKDWNIPTDQSAYANTLFEDDANLP